MEGAFGQRSFDLFVKASQVAVAVLELKFEVFVLMLDLNVVENYAINLLVSDEINGNSTYVFNLDFHG